MIRAPCFGSGFQLVKILTNEKGQTKIMQNVRFLSYLHQSGKFSFVYKTVGELLDDAARNFGDRTALHSVHQNKKITFQETKEKAEAIAAGLLASGIEKGDRVGIWTPNMLEWYVTSFALAKAGMISVYLNPAYEAPEITHCINAVGMKMLITTESFRDRSYPEILNKVAPELSKSEPGKLNSKNVPSLKTVVCISDKDIPGMIPFQSISEGGTESNRKTLQKIEKTITADDASNIQFTSGTTGAPKGAILGHFHIVNNSFFMAQRQELNLKRHTMCFMGPFFHAMGSVIGILTCLHEGVTLVSPAEAFSSSRAAQAIVDEKCTILLGTPTMYVDVIKVFQEKNLTPESPELAITGGAFAPVQLLNDIMEKLKVKRIASVYGLTETGPVSFMSMPTDSRDQLLTTVGFIMDHMEAKVVDENGMTVPWNVPGELWVRGYNIMKGYWGDEKKTKETLTSDNWLRTGDQFSISQDGYGKVVGRLKDLIIRGGENIYPADVEECISTHQSVLDVQVVGVPDKRLGEQVCACVRLKPGTTLKEEEVKEYCKGKIANYKIPHYVYFVDEFPKTPSGKVQKYLLRVQAIKHLKLENET